MKTAEVDLEVKDASDKRHSDVQDFSQILQKGIFKGCQAYPFVSTNS